MRLFPDKTQDQEFQDLGDLGYTGALNDRQNKYLKSLGGSGSLTDSFNQIQNAVVAKSVVFDIANNWGNSLLSIRAIDFYLSGSLVELEPTTDFTAYVTSNNSSFPPEYAFNTSRSRTGSHTGNAWLSGSGGSTNQRLTIVFNSEKAFDSIVVNNAHHNGTFTDRGARQVTATTSLDSITNTTYNAAISNSTVLSSSEWVEHVGANVLDNQTVWSY